MTFPLSLRSFQVRSIAATLVTSLAIWGGWALWALYDATQERSRRYDEELRLNAEVILGAFPRELIAHPQTTDFEIPQQGSSLDAAYEFNFQVWSRERRLVSRSTTTPTQPLNPRFTDGFSTTQIGDMAWRVYSLGDAGGAMQVQVASSLKQRQATAAMEARDGLLSLMTLLLPLTLCLLAVGVWTARPLRRLRDNIVQRRPNDDAPLSIAGLPSEAVPLVNAFNDMLQRSAQAREAQRRFVGDAAHELRTPLAALRVQAQVALRARDGVQRDAALARFIEGIDRTTRVTEQLLDLARMDSLAVEGASHGKHAVDLPALIASTVDGSRGLAERRRIQVRMRVEPLVVAGNRDLLSIALRNVLDNALRYSPPAAGVDVVATRREGAVLLSVIDGGSGLSADQRRSALQAFVRLSNTGDEYGSGLGLSIVQRISLLLGIGFELLDAPSGRGLEARFTLAPHPVSA